MIDTTHRKTTCPYCGVGCGVLVTPNEKGLPAIQGDPAHPANSGKLCSKGSDLANTLSTHQRLLYPYVNGQRVSWDHATDHVALKLNQTIATYGRESVAFYVSGQLLIEDYYVVNKLTKGWLGTANIDSNSRLCMASSVVGHKRAFGTDTVPGCYEDLESADLIILVGSNLAWCHPVVFQRIMAEKSRRSSLFLVVVDPRRTVTADAADLHLAIRPDTDTALFVGLLHYLIEHNACDYNYLRQHVNGFDDARINAHDWTLEQTAKTTGIEADLLSQFYKKVAQTKKTVTLYSQGVNQSRNGTEKVCAIINTHLATGRIGKTGMGPFSITGQPNAMGGREVGALATMLACHMELNNPQHQHWVQKFWSSPHMATRPGLCAVDMFKAVANGSIQAIWILGTNPVDSMPKADAVKQALKHCPLVIVSDVSAQSDTLDCAHVCLPAHAWGEKDGTVTNSERCISRQRKFKTAAGEALADWQAICQVARKMGFEHGFDFNSPADIFREHAALSCYENNGQRDFDIGATATISDEDYEVLQPFYWPCKRGSITSKPIRFFDQGGFFTTDKRAVMVATNPAQVGHAHSTSEYPMILNTGRIRDQWHTMTRTGYSVRLQRHLSEPFVEINPKDALAFGITDADIVRMRSLHAEVLLRALLSDRQTPGHVFSPMHWTNPFSSLARVNTLVASQMDPYSKQPALKNQAVSIHKFNARSFALLVSREKPDMQSIVGIDYWAIAPITAGWRVEMASQWSTQNLRQTLLGMLKKTSVTTPDMLSNHDSTKEVSQHALFAGDVLQSLLYLAPTPVVASRSWVQEQLDADWRQSTRRWRLLAARAGTDQPDKGAIVCSCFNVGVTDIKTAVMQQGCFSIAAIGQHLQAGTNCGSCRGEIQAIVTRCTQTLNLKCTTSPSRMT